MHCKLQLLLILFLVIAIDAEAQSGSKQSDLMVFFGIGLNSSYTEWDNMIGAYPNEDYRWYGHEYSRQLIWGGLEKRSILTLGDFRGDFRGELQFGFMGGTESDYYEDGYVTLENNYTISEGGMTFGLAAIMKFAYPTKLGENLPVAPYAGIGHPIHSLSIER